MLKLDRLPVEVDLEAEVSPVGLETDAFGAGLAG